MLLADPLSRICAPSDGFYDVELPWKIQALLGHLPEEVATCRTIRVYANNSDAWRGWFRSGESQQILLGKEDSLPTQRQGTRST